MVTLDSSEEGKTVLDDDGREVGVVVEVERGRAYVDPDPSMLDEIGSRFGVSNADEDTFPIEADDVRAVTDEEIHLTEWTDPNV
ncbi:PRC-barrel domain containing protein [Natrononativus amylolyticus]|uniref:PRC-barrel domain containing protein n=1 Tax=Natrononativus amylolyticus TaxID=2963434 RepID=UPI0020CDD52F|nr:PRC-barrel domain containing protein [Natrononativus amylolyticus]